MVSFFYRLPRSAAAVFKPRNLIWHAIAIILTLCAVLTGFDWWYFEHTRSSVVFQLAMPAAMLGFIVPVFTPFILIFSAKTKEMQRLGYALGQSAVLSWLLSALYKAATGRVHPALVDSTLTLPDISRQFQFGLLKGGIFWGWPSSHTTVAFAVAATALTLFPGNPRVKFWAVIFAVYVGIGVSLTIHWFSDFAAGAILGSLVGVIVGQAYRSSPL
jgi:membrane-associated phospholipid phosphatase